MAILAFQRPDSVLELEANGKYGKFEFRPLEVGYGITIGNSLRRVLLSSLEGFAITSIKIEGVNNEFSVVRGILEDIANIILKLKQVRFKQINKEIEFGRALLSISGVEEFIAEDIEKQLEGFQILNPRFVIAHLNKKAKLQIELTVGKGRGYVPAEENQIVSEDVNRIAIDSIYTPIVNVKYKVEPFRVEQKTDFEKLIFEITTDGSISPRDALKEAANILIGHFVLFSDGNIHLEKNINMMDEFDENALRVRQLLKNRLFNMGLSVRALNCLRAEGIETLEDLVKLQRNELMKFRNFGKKSLVELEELLERLHLSFGMDLKKYKFGVKNET